jgi:hypothetical protein
LEWVARQENRTERECRGKRDSGECDDESLIEQCAFLRMDGNIQDPWALSPKQWGDQSRAIVNILKQRMKANG